MIKKTIIISLLIIIITTLAFSYYYDQTLLTRLEAKYNNTQNYNDLIHLCNNLYELMTIINKSNIVVKC